MYFIDRRSTTEHSFEGLKNYLLLVAKGCAKCLEHHRELWCFLPEIKWFNSVISHWKTSNKLFGKNQYKDQHLDYGTGTWQNWESLALTFSSSACQRQIKINLETWHHNVTEN